MKSKSDKNGPKLFKEEGRPEDLQYPPNEDIYSKEERLPLAEEETFEMESRNKVKPIGDDLDVPGTELDDKEEAIGEEDEENNYYSLGGDNHSDLDESRDE